jgi:hypothetical protein
MVLSRGDCSAQGSGAACGTPGAKTPSQPSSPRTEVGPGASMPAPGEKFVTRGFKLYELATLCIGVARSSHANSCGYG